MSSITKKFSRACEILDKYERNPSKLIPILQDMQAEYAYLPEEIMTFISVALGISQPPFTAWQRFTRISPWSRRAATSSRSATARPATSRNPKGF